LSVEKVLADTNYSGGEAYRYLEGKGIAAFIPVCGSCKAYRDGFQYDKEADCYICAKGVRLTLTHRPLSAMRLGKAAKEALWKKWAMAQSISGWHKLPIAM